MPRPRNGPKNSVFLLNQEKLITETQLLAFFWEMFTESAPDVHLRPPSCLPPSIPPCRSRSSVSVRPLLMVLVSQDWVIDSGTGWLADMEPATLLHSSDSDSDELLAF